MSAMMKNLGIDRLSVDERLKLVEDIWDSIATSPSAVPLTEAHRRELDRRMERHALRPEEVVPWTEIKQAADARHKP